MSKIHNWLVVRGRASIWSESSRVLLELDPEGSTYCVLSVKDAKEIAEIIADEARSIWDASEKQFAEPARVEGDVRQSCKLWTEAEILQLVAHETEPLVALALDSGSRCSLDVTRAVALVQILVHMSEALSQRVAPNA